VDAGPLVALVDADDQHHAKCVAAFNQIADRLATVWPPLVEAMYMLHNLPSAREGLWEMIERQALALLPLDLLDVPRIRELMRKYQDVPMDFPDAALVHVAERQRIQTIFTVDRRDFAIYRLRDRGRLTIIP
jgi:uncharacterized protein